MDTKYIIKGITREGRIVPVPVRYQYDYDDNFPFEGSEYSDTEAALDALRTHRDDIRLHGDIKYVTILTVVDL